MVIVKHVIISITAPFLIILIGHTLSYLFG